MKIFKLTFEVWGRKACGIFLLYLMTQSLFVLSGEEEDYFLVQSRWMSPDTEQVAGAFTGSTAGLGTLCCGGWLESSDVG